MRNSWRADRENEAARFAKSRESRVRVAGSAFLSGIPERDSFSSFYNIGLTVDKTGSLRKIRDRMLSLSLFLSPSKFFFKLKSPLKLTYSRQSRMPLARARRSETSLATLAASIRVPRTANAPAANADKQKQDERFRMLSYAAAEIAVNGKGTVSAEQTPLPGR